MSCGCHPDHACRGGNTGFLISAWSNAQFQQAIFDIEGIEEL